LKYAGVLNPTDMPHHLRAFEDCEYREGVVLDKPLSKSGGTSFAYIGLKKDCELDKSLKAGLRVTVKLTSETKHNLRGQVVAPSVPREESGLYWGYSVRSAPSLSSVFTKSPFKGGYDLTIGTSERGQNIDDLETVPKFKHLLIVFGGVHGLEVALEADENLDVSDPEPLFDLYLNTCPNQGSRTIRSEEAVLVTLAALRPKINKQ
jgi:predicted SPOUT superfamily RNA methylase MTH1